MVGLNIMLNISVYNECSKGILKNALKLRMILTGALCGILASTSALAEDIEIYLPEVKPNLLLVLDNSLASQGTNLLERFANLNVGLSFIQGTGIAQDSVDIDAAGGRPLLLSKIGNVPSDSGHPLDAALLAAHTYLNGDGKPTHTCQQTQVVLVSDALPSGSGEQLSSFGPAGSETSCSDNGCLDEIAAAMPSGVHVATIGFGVDLSSLDDAGEGGSRYFQVSDTDGLIARISQLLEANNSSVANNNVSGFTSAAVSNNSLNAARDRNFIYFGQFIPAITPRWEGNIKKYRVAFNNGEPIISGDTEPPTNIVSSTGQFIDSAKSYWGASGRPADGNNILMGGARALLDAERRDSDRMSTDVATFPGTEVIRDIRVPNISENNIFDVGNNQITSSYFGLPSEATGTDPSDVPERNQLIRWVLGFDEFDEDSDSATTERRSYSDALHSQPVVVSVDTSDIETQNDIRQMLLFTTTDGYFHILRESNGKEHFAYIPEEVLGIQKILADNHPYTRRPYGLDGSITPLIEERIQESGATVGDIGVINSQAERFEVYFGMRRGGRNYYALDLSFESDNIVEGEDAENVWLPWKIVEGNVVAGIRVDGFGRGAEPAPITTQPYAELGQTWSQPSVAVVNISGERKVLIVVGGGYDPDQDDATARQVDDSGRAIYFINVNTGVREWWAGHPDSAHGTSSGPNLPLENMQYSIPSQVAVYDIDGDGFSDRLYVGDMGGQLWRFDINNGNPADTLVTGGVIASLAGSSATDARRFYYPPDVARVARPSGSFLAVTIGSGYRAHPLDKTIQDRIYMIRDPDVFSAPANYTALTESDLFDATANTVGQGSDQSAQLALLEAAGGWYIKLDAGEKMLSSPLILGGAVIATTFQPTTGSDTAPCTTPIENVASTYTVDLSNATPRFNFDNIGSELDLTKADRKKKLGDNIGIPAAPAYLITTLASGSTSATDGTAHSAAALLLGNQTGQDPTENRPIKTYWYEDN